MGGKDLLSSIGIPRALLFGVPVVFDTIHPQVCFWLKLTYNQWQSMRVIPFSLCVTRCKRILKDFLKNVFSALQSSKEEFRQTFLSAFFIPGPTKLSPLVWEIAVLQTVLVQTCFILESTSRLNTLVHCVSPRGRHSKLHSQAWPALCPMAFWKHCTWHSSTFRRVVNENTNLIVPV